MKTGTVKGHGPLSYLVTILLLMGPGLKVQAATPASTCANDSLFLISPPEVTLEQQFEGRSGLTVSWQDLDQDEVTCFVLTGVDSLAFDVDVSGGFGDSQDRQFVFNASVAGEVGGETSENLILNWMSEGDPTAGTFGGIINLSNNGGVVSFSEANSQWNQINDGLPLNWARTNTVALDHGTGGFMVAAFSGGLNLDTLPGGLYTFNGSTWQRVAEDIIDDDKLVTWISISPSNNEFFAVGTSRDGLFITRDGGLSFQAWGANLDPAIQPQPTVVKIDGLNWSSSRLWVNSSNFGLFYSADNGMSFDRSDLQVAIDLEDPDLGTAVPVTIKDIVVNPTDEDHILVAMEAHGVFQSFDGGQTWHDTYGDLQVIIPSNPGAWRMTATSVLVEPSDPNILISSVASRGIYRTNDGGVHWTRVGEGASNPNSGALLNMNLLISDRALGEYYCLQDNWALLFSSDYGVTWGLAPFQPLLKTGTRLLNVGDGSGDLLFASYGGGIFVPGSSLSLSSTYSTGTSPDLLDLDLGLEITIGAGHFTSGPQFGLKCQTFQGWAVWRALNSDPDEMVMIGLFDRTNPESCIEGYCGDMSFEVIPQCYNSKRAACFNFDTPDTIRFFDNEIFNGYAYYYAVTTFDYGNTALSSSENTTNIPVYSPRWDDDTLTPYPGLGNRLHIQLNDPETDPEMGEEIYVFPNPLRANVGIPGQEGKTVVFTKLPPGSRISVFTTAGDNVIELGPEEMRDGNIYWNTRNKGQESIGAGVYLYKVVMPSREDYWGKLVVIR